MRKQNDASSEAKLVSFSGKGYQSEKINLTAEVTFVVFDRENEACLRRESGLQESVQKANENPRTTLGRSSSRAGWQGHAERNRVGALADNVGRHDEVVPGLASQARHI